MEDKKESIDYSNIIELKEFIDFNKRIEATLRCHDILKQLNGD